MGFTTNQWAIVALVFILGWLLGLLSRSDRGWRRRYEEEHAALVALRKEHDAHVRATNARIAELERHQPAVGAGMVIAIGRA